MMDDTDRHYPDEACLGKMRELLNDGLPLDALALVDGMEPPREWLHQGPLHAYIATRLLNWLGDASRGRSIIYCARQLYPDSG